MKPIAIMALWAVLAGGGFFAEAQSFFRFIAQPLAEGEQPADIEALSAALYSAIVKENIPAYKKAMSHLIHNVDQKSHEQNRALKLLYRRKF